MKLALIGTIFLAVVLLARLLGIRLQLRSMRRQLEKRQREQSKTPLFLEMHDRELRALAAAVNRSLKQEEKLLVKQEIQEQELKDLISNISHDLRTPLTVTKGYLQLLEGCEIDPAGKEYLQTCFRHTQELEGRIRQFFEYSVLTAREEPLQLQPLAITNIVTNVMSDFVPLFEEKGLCMRLEQESVVTGLAQEEALRRMLQNMFRNCLNYGVKEMSVSVTETEDQKQVKICVKNPVASGCTLDVGQVFQRFYVGDSARNHSTGLGLAIVKRLAEQMQGSVSAEMEGELFCVMVRLKSGRG